MRTFSPRRSRIGKLFALMLASLFAFAFTASAASADDVVTNPGEVELKLVGGVLAIGDGSLLPHIDISELGDGEDAPTLTGNVDANGNLVVPQGNISFPEMPVQETIEDIPIIGSIALDLMVSIVANQDATGTINPVTGEANLNVALRIELRGKIGSVTLNNDGRCRIPSIPLNLSTEKPNGQPYDSSTGQARVQDDNFPVSAFPTSGSPCGTLLFIVNVASTLNSQLGLPIAAGASNAELQVETSPKLEGPGGGSTVEPFNVEFDNGLVSFGPWSDLERGGDGASVALAGEFDSETGEVTVPAEGADLSLLTTPFDIGMGTGIRGSVDFSVSGSHLAGTWKPGSGQMTIRGGVKATVTLVDGSDNVVATCYASTNLRFSTDRTSPYRGQRFTEGLEGPGAIVTGWDTISGLTGDEGCSDLDEFVAGPGGIWLSQDIAPPAPVEAPVSVSAPVLTNSAGDVVEGVTPGKRLICEAGEWDGANGIVFTWTRNGEAFSNVLPNGQTSAVYRTTEADDGATFACGQTASNEAGSTDSASSNEVAVASPAPIGPVELTAARLVDSSGELADVITPGRRLICEAGTWDNITGSVIQWRRDGEVFENLLPNGQTNGVYRPTAGDVGSTFTCEQVVRNQDVSGVVGTPSNAAVVIGN